MVSVLLKRDSYALLFFLLAVCGQPQWILHLLAVGLLIHVLPFIAVATFAGSRHRSVCRG